jgi:hypothetical protein
MLILVAQEVLLPVAQMVLQVVPVARVVLEV